MSFSNKICLAKLEHIFVLAEIERKASSLFKETRFYSAVGDDVTTLEDFKEAQEEGNLFVALNEQDQPIGFAFLEIMDHGIHLDELDVLPEFGGQGVGTALVKEVCAWAKEKKYNEVTLTTYRDVPWNAPFYKKLGFRELAIKEMPEPLYQLFLREHEQGLLMKDRLVMIFEVEK